jgi:hypothetical protein
MRGAGSIVGGGRLKGMVLVGIVACSVAVLLAVSQRAEAYIYWSNQTAGSIGRANTNGTGVNQSFITGLGRVVDVAVDDYHIYWTLLASDNVGRASLDGTNVKPNFITGCTNASGLAIYNDHIYWANSNGYIGRAGTDGSGVNQHWIDCDGESPFCLTGHAGYYYWAWYPAYHAEPNIARCNPPTASGGKVHYTNILGDYWIYPVYGLCATASHLWWRSDGVIGRAGTPDGISPDRDYITGLEGYGSGLAVLDNHIYYTTTGFYEGPANIGRVGTDGSSLNNAFITGCQTPSGVAADSRGPSTSLAAAADEIGASGLPLSVTIPLALKLKSARAAYDRGLVRTASLLVESAISQIRVQSGARIPTETAERWMTGLRLLKVHVV